MQKAEGITHMLWVSYRLKPMTIVQAKDIAEKICLEQTVELDGDLVWDDAIRDQIVGKIAAIKPDGQGGYLVRIGYDPRVTGWEIPQFLNVLFGNSCFKKGVQLWDFEWDDAWLPGPQYGIKGLRDACRVASGPLLATALKPMGSSVTVLAEMARDLALGGIHIIKDDHGLANQVYHPFKDRVLAVSQALKKVNTSKGQNCLYFPNFAPPLDKIDEYLLICRQAGVPGLLVSPHLVGMDMVRFLREHSEFMLMLHPAWTGSHFHTTVDGVHPAFLLGKLFRAMGGDCSIFPSTGGRFGFDQQTCTALVNALRDPCGNFLPAFPVPAGGMSLAQIPEVRASYGDDLILLIGSGLYRVNRDLRLAVAAFRQVVEG